MKKNSKRNRLCICLLLSSLLLPLPFYGQDGSEVSSTRNQNSSTVSLRGTIVDEQGEPLVGVSVVVKGTTNGTMTDIDGKFQLQVPSGSVIEVTYLGYTSQTIKIGTSPSKNLDIILKEEEQSLDEVVVTALGIKRAEKALSYNVQQIKSEQITAVKDANFMNALTGKVAGVTINASSAGAGAAARVIMRGVKSLEKDDNALYVIDGIPMRNVNSGDNSGGTMSYQPGSSSAADINPDDIESISILTGPSAAALYGSDASNGVVIITTKRGAAGRTRLSINQQTLMSTPLLMPKFQNTYANREGESMSWGRKMDVPSSYNPKDFFQTGVTSITGFTFSSGNENRQTYASASSTNTKNILPNSNYNRYNFSFRNTAKILNDKLQLDLSGQYIYQSNKNMVGSGQYFNPLVSLYLFPRGENFQELQLFERYSEARNIMIQYWPESIYGTALDMQNPYWIMYRMNNKTQKQRYLFHAGLQWDIAPWINIASRVRIDNSTQDNYLKYYASTRGTFTEGSSKGLYGHTKQNDYMTYIDAIVNINKEFEKQKITLTANIGASLNDAKQDNLYMKGGLSQIPNMFHIGNIKMSTQKRNEHKWHDQTQSIFFSSEIGWNQQLYLTLTGRNDWDSKLAFTDQESYFYPSVGLSWVVSESVRLPQWLSYLKTRLSWAEVASAPGRYLTQMQYSYREQTDTYVYPSDHYNTNLKPENTKSWETGINTKMWNNKVSLDLTLYRSNTFNQTFYVDASGSSGYTRNIVQTGNIRNQGIELGLGYRTNIKDVSISTNFTYTLNQNRIISLANGAKNPDTGELIDMEYYSKGTLGIAGGPTIRLQEGGTMGDLYINRRLRQSPNGYIWRDPADGSVAIENTEYRKIGSMMPKYRLGLNGSIGYKKVQLGYTFNARIGGLVVSDTQAMLDRYGVSEESAKARDEGGVLVGSSRVDAEDYYKNISTAIGTYYTYSATNVRLSEVNLSWQVPSKWFKNKLDVNVGVTGRNLWMIYNKAPFDPESTASVTSNFYQGVDYFQLPSLKSIGFNIKLSL